jgi:hypothetical protein
LVKLISTRKYFILCRLYVKPIVKYAEIWIEDDREKDNKGGMKREV